MRLQMRGMEEEPVPLLQHLGLNGGADKARARQLINLAVYGLIDRGLLTSAVVRHPRPSCDPGHVTR